MILEIGRFVLAESCRQMVAWQERFEDAAPDVVCANISGRQLTEGDLVAEIAAILKQTGLPPAMLKLEITETAFISDVSGAQDTVSRSQLLGIGWSLDDFGTGYSSLSYLHQLRVDTVKVDRSFVNLLGTEGPGSEMVRAVVALAHNLGMDVVAEGVETAAQSAELRGLGCEHAQGFYFSKAVDDAGAALLIATQPWCSASLSRI